ncbi:hypothetical protein GQ44DRAFT_729695 [Phaeosphaeriaceae sp. PMI808]|nr:hypothetical protein GQ44DRAFT_729695 [Phaeosphaeriaceae sp. PMI808]
MHVHLLPLVTTFSALNIAIAAFKFGVCWQPENYRRSQLWVFVAGLATAITALVVTIIMNVFGVSVTDQLGHEKLRKVFLCSVVLNCAILEAYQIEHLWHFSKIYDYWFQWTPRADWAINVLALGSVPLVELIPIIVLLTHCYKSHNSALVLHLWSLNWEQEILPEFPISTTRGQPANLVFSANEGEGGGSKEARFGFTQNLDSQEYSRTVKDKGDIESSVSTLDTGYEKSRGEEATSNEWAY